MTPGTLPWPTAKGEADLHDVYKVPESWAPPKATRNQPQEPSPFSFDQDGGPPKHIRKPKYKIRRTSISVCVSEEEEYYLRQYAARKGMTFSAWVRGVLFEVMGKDAPTRPGA